MTNENSTGDTPASGQQQREVMWRNAERLDKNDIAGLERGDEILVKWSGGNGPYRYVLIRDKYGTAGVVSKKDWERRHEIPPVRNLLPVDRVGKQPLTEVRRAT
jgi:hypothetical protein